MKPFQAYRLDRLFLKEKDLQSGHLLEFLTVRAVPLFQVWAVSPEEALKMAQTDHPFPHRLCISPCKERTLQ